MHTEIVKYNQQLNEVHQLICERLAQLIDEHLPESNSKIWHGHPVWFLNENPIVGYSLQKAGVRLMFWSGTDFNEPALNVKGEKFMDASKFYNDHQELNEGDIKRWLQKSRVIQWDYKNLIKRKGKLLKLEL